MAEAREAEETVGGSGEGERRHGGGGKILAEIPGHRPDVVRAVRRLKEKVGKQLAKALRWIPKRPRKQSLPSEPPKASGVFRAPIPSVLFDDGDLDPWVSNHGQSLPPSMPFANIDQQPPRPTTFRLSPPQHNRSLSHYGR